eukprot:6103245-Alexandrium_andersonii.AAC.1
MRSEGHPGRTEDRGGAATRGTGRPGAHHAPCGRASQGGRAQHGSPGGREPAPEEEGPGMSKYTFTPLHARAQHFAV